MYEQANPSVIEVTPPLDEQSVLLVSPETDPDNPPSIDWWITSRCNLACDFCYGPMPTSDPAELRLQIAAELAASPAETITFCGGEPLVLAKEIFQYAHLFKAAGKRVVLNTNGELLERAISKYLEPGEELPFDVVGVSVDGPTELMHAAMRDSGRRANLYKTFAGIREVKKHPDTLLKIASVVSDVSINWLREMIEFADNELQADVLRLYHYNPHGDYNTGQAMHGISKARFDKQVAEYLPYARPQLPVHVSDNESQACLIVDPNGNVSISTKSGYDRLGNCLSEPIANIWERQSQSTRGLVKRNKKWIGSTLVSTQAGLITEESGRNETRPDPIEVREAQQELETLQQLVSIESARTAIRTICVGAIEGVLPLAEMQEAYWQEALQSLKECNLADFRETSRIAARFLSYATRAGLTT
jgi:MoaA/NifB/PqqE/SkfB family radical SAM enzyme